MTPKTKLQRRYPDSHCRKVGAEWLVYSKNFGLFSVPVLGRGASAAAAWADAYTRETGRTV